MSLTFDQLLDEVLAGSATRLVDRPVGPAAVRLLIVQRADGSIWEATNGRDTEANAWALDSLQRVFLGVGRMTKFAPELDLERLGRYIALLAGQDRAEAERIEEWAAVRAAETLLQKARAS